MDHPLKPTKDHPLKPTEDGESDDDTGANVVQQDTTPKVQENGSQIMAEKEEIGRNNSNEQGTGDSSNGADNNQGETIQVEKKIENENVETNQLDNIGNERIEESNQMGEKQIERNRGEKGLEHEKPEYPVAEDKSKHALETGSTHSTAQQLTKARKT
jgi:hypothetical protein